MEEEKKQRKVCVGFFCPKNKKLFLGHGVSENMLNRQSYETQKQAVEFCPTELVLWIISL